MKYNAHALCMTMHAALNKLICINKSCSKVMVKGVLCLPVFHIGPEEDLGGTLGSLFQCLPHLPGTGVRE